MKEAWTTDLQHREISRQRFFPVFHVIMLFICPFKGAFGQYEECVVAPKVRKFFAILFENNLVLRTSQKVWQKRHGLFRTPWLHYSSWNLRSNFNTRKIQIRTAVRQLSIPALIASLQSRLASATERLLLTVTFSAT